MEHEEKKISYEELKRGAAQKRVGWRHRHWNLPYGRARKEERKNNNNYLIFND